MYQFNNEYHKGHKLTADEERHSKVPNKGASVLVGLGAWLGGRWWRSGSPSVEAPSTEKQGPRA